MPRTHTCADCGCRFSDAETHRMKGDRHWCPMCRPVEPIAASVARAVSQDTRPVRMDVAELMDGGDPR